MTDIPIEELERRMANAAGNIPGSTGSRIVADKFHVRLDRASPLVVGHASPMAVPENQPDWEIPRVTFGGKDVPFLPTVSEIELKPISILLNCPCCGERHIDEGEWAERPHHTHACQSCGTVWRPALVDTVGVRFLPGFKNDGVGS